MEAGNHDSLADQLLELHTIQEARIAAEEEARFRAAEDARRRAEDAARKRREQDEARLRAEEETRLGVERAQREEEERRVREANESELRVQLQEQAKARAAEQQRVLEHEKELAAITAVEKAKIRSRRLVIGGLLVRRGWLCRRLRVWREACPRAKGTRSGECPASPGARARREKAR